LTARFLADQSTLDEIIGGFGVSDAVANIVRKSFEIERTYVLRIACSSKS
jgi:hypothetical protein